MVRCIRLIVELFPDVRARFARGHTSLPDVLEQRDVIHFIAEFLVSIDREIEPRRLLLFFLARLLIRLYRLVLIQVDLCQGLSLRRRQLLVTRNGVACVASRRTQLLLLILHVSRLK